MGVALTEGGQGRGTNPTTKKRCRIRARAQTPLLARSEPINEGITAKIRPRYPQCTHGGAARVSTCSTVVSENSHFGPFRGVFGPF